MGLKLLIGLLAGIPFSLLAQSGANFDIKIVQPKQNAYVLDTINLQASIQSTYELQSVSATIDQVTQPLGFFPGNRTWTNTVSLTGLSHGLKTVTFKATDVFGNTGQVQTTVFYRLPPTLTVNEPRVGTVLRGFPLALFPIDVTASSDGSGDTTIVLNYADSPFAYGWNTMTGTAQFPPDDAPLATITIDAVDSTGQKATVTRDLYLLGSTNWGQVSMVDGPILDQNATNILFVDGNALVSKSRVSGTKTVLINQPDIVPSTAALTTSGVILQTTNNQIFELRNGVLTNLGSGYSLNVRDNYAGWCSAQGAQALGNLYDLGAGLVKTFTNATSLSVGPNGTFAFVTMPKSFVTWEVWQGHGSELTNVASSSYEFEYFGAQTDGTNVLYGKHLLGGGSLDANYFVALFDGTSETTLGTNQTASFAINSGWVAFTTLENYGITQVCTRSPGGAIEQRTFFGTDSAVVALAPNGELVVRNQNKLNLVREGQEPCNLGYPTGCVFWNDNKWQYALGRSLFELFSPVVLNVSQMNASSNDHRIKAKLQAGEYVLQFSTDLLSWADIATTNTTDFCEAEFSHTTNSASGFYRVYTK